MAGITWQVSHGRYRMADIAWQVSHGRYRMAGITWPQSSVSDFKGNTQSVLYHIPHFPKFPLTKFALEMLMSSGNECCAIQYQMFERLYLQVYSEYIYIYIYIYIYAENSIIYLH